MESIPEAQTTSGLHYLFSQATKVPLTLPDSSSNSAHSRPPSAPRSLGLSLRVYLRLRPVGAAGADDGELPNSWAPTSIALPLVTRTLRPAGSTYSDWGAKL
jgi:hypothetical protein